MKQDRRAWPSWFWEPPLPTVGGGVPDTMIFTRTPSLVAYGTSVRAYPAGFGFSVHVLQRWPADEGQARRDSGVIDVLSASTWPTEEMHAREAAELIGVEAENLTPDRLGPSVEIRYADAATSRLHEGDRRDWNWLSPEDYDAEAAGVRRSPGGSSRVDSGAIASSRFWAWPLPPPGPVVVRFVWPEFGIDGSAELEGTALRRAAESSINLWPAAE